MVISPHALHRRLGSAIGHLMDRMLTHSNPGTLEDWTRPSGARTTRRLDATALEARVLANRRDDVLMAAKIDARLAERRSVPQTPCACPACTGSTVVENP